MSDENHENNLVIFLEGKDEPYTVSNGYGKLALALQRNHSLEIKRAFLDNVDPDDLERAMLLVFAGPRRSFSIAEFEALHTFRNLGINLLFILGEGGQEEIGTNVNTFLFPLGITFARDCVMRRMHYKYYHPKQAVITDAVLENSPISEADVSGVALSTELMYPFGCTLEVKNPAIPVLTSGKCCYPSGRAICAMSVIAEDVGKVVCFGSLFAFHDEFIERQDNEKLFNSLIAMVSTPSREILKKASQFPEASDIPDRPPRQLVHPLTFQLRPVFDGLFDDLDVEEVTLNGAGNDEYAARLHTDAEIIRVGRHLALSWDINGGLLEEFAGTGHELNAENIPFMRLLGSRSRNKEYAEMFWNPTESGTGRDIDEQNCSGPPGPLALLDNSFDLHPLETDNSPHASQNPASIGEDRVQENAADAPQDAQLRATYNQLQNNEGKTTSEAPKFSHTAATGFLIAPSSSSSTDGEILRDCLSRRSTDQAAGRRCFESLVDHGNPKQIDFLSSCASSSDNTALRPATAKSSFDTKGTASSFSSRAPSSLCLSIPYRQTEVDVWRPPDSGNHSDTSLQFPGSW